MGIGIDRIQAVTSSASAIADIQIQNIIKCFPQGPDNTDEGTNCNAHVTESF
jgi:hypothetical protein